jgi:hypothetical protein
MDNAPQKRSRRLPGFLSKRWVWITAILLTLFLLILVCLPLGILYGIRRGLLAGGAQEVLVENVDFNPFTAKLVLYNLEVKMEGKRLLVVPEATIDMNWMPLWHKHAELAVLSIKDLNIVIERMEDGRFRVGGLVFQKSAGADEELSPLKWGFGVTHVGRCTVGCKGSRRAW